MKKYLQYRRGYLCIWLLLCSVPILVQLLYGQALESILYGVGLATVLVLLFMVHDFLHFREKEEKRKQIAQNMGSRELCLFETNDPVEKEYLDLLGQLTERYCKQAEQLQTATKERQEYYTTWVHQVKTPMAAMNMLLQKEDTPESRQLQLQLFRMEEYVEMILHFTRLEESGPDFVFDAYDLDEMIRRPSVNTRLFLCRKRLQSVMIRSRHVCLPMKNGFALCWNRCFPMHSNIQIREV